MPGLLCVVHPPYLAASQDRVLGQRRYFDVSSLAAPARDEPLPSFELAGARGGRRPVHSLSLVPERPSQPPDDPTVVFLAYSEIRSARGVREHVTKPDMNGRSTTEIQHWVELELATDTAALVDAPGTERGRPAAMEKRWYGNSST